MATEAEPTACKDCLMLREEFAKNPGKKVEPNKAVAFVVVGITGLSNFISHHDKLAKLLDARGKLNSGYCVYLGTRPK